MISQCTVVEDCPAWIVPIGDQSLGPTTYLLLFHWQSRLKVSHPPFISLHVENGRVIEPIGTLIPSSMRGFSRTSRATFCERGSSGPPSSTLASNLMGAPETLGGFRHQDKSTIASSFD